MRKINRSELRDFDVYGAGEGSFIFISVELARLFSEHPPDGIKLSWTDDTFSGKFSFEELQARSNGAPLHYCVSVLHSGPTNFVFVPTRIDARSYDVRNLFEGEEVKEDSRKLREVIRKAVASPARIADRNHERWLKGPTLEERRVKEMLDRRRQQEVKDALQRTESRFTRGDRDANCRRSNAVVDLGNRLFSFSPRCNQFKEDLDVIRKFGITESSKKDLLSKIAEAERDIASLRKAIEGMR